MDIFPVVPGMTLELGKTGTHYVRAFRFDISAWQEAYPDGIINLIHRLPDANEPYVAGYLRLGEGYIDWVVQSSDVAVPGYGECELVMIVDGVAVDKTDTYPTHIEEQLGSNSVTPPTGASWVEQVLTVGNATLQAVEGFEDLVDEKEQDITDLASGKEQNITDLAAQKIAAIEAKGAQTLDSIPEDYTELSDDVDELKSAINVLEPTATSADIGKALIVKTVENGKASEYEFGETGEGWTPAMKSALLQCFQHVTWDDEHGQDYYDEMYNALYPPVRISALYDSTHVASIGDSLDSLRPYMTVKAHYNGKPDVIVTNYSLSGSLNVGTATITVSYVGLQTTVSVTVVENPDIVDVCLFAGQSNMDGRGTAADAPTVQQGTAYLWNASNNTVVDFAAEGSLIPAFVKTYFESEHVPIVEVKEAVGGTSISTYVSVNLPNAKTKLENCINYLENHGKQVRRCFMLWNQGENDVTDGTSASTYETLFAQLKSGVMASGVEKIFIINIGQASSGNLDYSTIRNALDNVCDDNAVAMVSDKFYNSLDYMKDQFHYTQIVYNTVGKDSAINVSAFYNNQARTIKQFDAADVYGVPETYGTLTDWNYILHSTRVVLTGYIGTDPDVRVYRMYLHNGSYYEARLAKATSTNNSVFGNNSAIETITVDDGVLLINHANFNEAATQQNMSSFFKNATALTSVTLGNTPTAITDMSYAFQNCEKDVQINFLPRTSGNFREAFRSTGIKHIGNLSGVTRADGMAQENTALSDVGDIDGTYSDISSAFRGCSSLESVGVFKSTSLTNIGSMFYGCTKIAGIIKFLSSSISNAVGAFNNVDLTKVEIQVPANSTSYDTITTAWPDANVTTF